jgi:general secretion pathway protein I
MTFAIDDSDLATSVAQDEGFTLLEVLIALTILALSATTLFGAFFGALEQSRQDAFASEARILAHSLLVEEGRSLSATDRQGVTPSGFEWSVHVARSADSDDRPTTLQIATIAIRIAWQDGGIIRAVTVNTLAFAPPMRAP